MKMRLGRLAVTLMSAVLGTMLTPTAAMSEASDCTEESFPVRISGLASTHNVVGTLCPATNSASDGTVVITAHGATYNRSYWDWPQDSSLSVVQRLVKQASVLNLDLLGAGQSGRPPSVLLTMQAQASALHQVVLQVRERGYDKVVLLGHSSGSGAVTVEASKYRDVDGLIVTGFLHRDPGLSVPLSMYPAALDPAFRSQLRDPGYLTTRPGTRSTNGFFNTAVADPEVIAYDEAHKDVVPFTYAAGFPLMIHNKSISRAVEVPVLAIVGSSDAPFCGTPDCAPAQNEASAWSEAAQLEVQVIPDAGHDTHLHGQSYAESETAHISDWLTRHFK